MATKTVNFFGDDKVFCFFKKNDADRAISVQLPAYATDFCVQ